MYNFLENQLIILRFQIEEVKKKCAVHFIEVKSGNSNLNGHQKNIKDAILKGRIHWHEHTVDGIWEHETRKQHLNKKEKIMKKQAVLSLSGGMDSSTVLLHLISKRL